MIEPNFVPEDGRLCENCIFFKICPWDWQCETAKLTEFWEEQKNVHNGNSTEEVR